MTSKPALAEQPLTCHAAVTLIIIIIIMIIIIIIIIILHIAVYVLHCHLPNSKASRGAACSLSLLARGHDDAILLGTDCTKASSFGCISPEGLSCSIGVRGALPAPRHQSTSWCSLFGLSGGKGTHRCMT